MSNSESARNDGAIIRASEIGEYVYCERAWWLGRVEGVENANRAEMDAGIERHRAHGQAVQRADLLGRVSLGLILIALILVGVLVARWLGVF